MFINHLLNGMILQVPKTYPCLSNLDRVYIGHASSLPVTRDPHLSPGWSKAWLISCPAFAIMPSKELSVEFLWQKMTSVSFTVRGGFHSLKVSKLKIHSILGELVEYTYMIRRDII